MDISLCLARLNEVTGMQLIPDRNNAVVFTYQKRQVLLRFFPEHNTYLVYAALQPLHRAALPAALEELLEKNFLLSETLSDQTLKQGMFSIVPNSDIDADDSYGFGNDFYRAINPLGVRNNPNGCTITVIVNNQETLFTQQEYKNVTEEERGKGNTFTDGSIQHPYMKKMVDTIQPLCASKAQLTSVGLCTTQAIQSSLRMSGFIYKDITGGSLEHTADHKIEKLPDGSIKVTVNEKPGTLFQFHAEMIVDQNGKITMNDGFVTFPSLEKWRQYGLEHPEEELR